MQDRCCNDLTPAFFPRLVMLCTRISQDLGDDLQNRYITMGELKIHQVARPIFDQCVFMLRGVIILLAVHADRGRS